MNNKKPYDLEKLNKEFIDELGYSHTTLLDLFQHFATSRAPKERLWKLLDACDRGYFWDIVKSAVPGYAVKPDTNEINYMKTQLMNNIYSGSYRGEVIPRNFKNKEAARKINQFLEYIWDIIGVPKYTLLAGDRAALFNMGVVQFGWNGEMITSSEKLQVGELEMAHIDTLKFFPDPATRENPYNGRAMFIADEVPLIQLLGEKRFRRRAQEYKKLLDTIQYDRSNLTPQDYGKGYYDQRARQPKDGTVRFLTCYYKYATDEGFRIDQVWMVDDGFILDIKKDIRPKVFPIRVLYASPPTADCFGTPLGKLILNNYISVNIIDSTDITHQASLLKRPRILNRNSGINEKQFAKYGNHPDKLWVANTNPDNVVKYIDPPNLDPNRYVTRQNLQYSNMRLTGVDDRYTGRDTGSVQTTGAMQQMQMRIASTDNTRIAMLGEFIKSCTELILHFYIEFGGQRTFPRLRPNGEVSHIEELDFDELKKSGVQFDYKVDITPHLPNNIERRSMEADIMMEKQMQYQFNPPIITPEEWVTMKNFAEKNHMIDRMIYQRMQDDKQDITSILVSYANLVNQGVSPEGAVDMLANERQAQRENPPTAPMMPMPE